MLQGSGNGRVTMTPITPASVTDFLRGLPILTLVFSSVKWQWGRTDKIISKAHTNIKILG